MAFLCVLSATHLGGARAAEADRPVGPNCELAAPPATAGEAARHGGLMQVYPRKADIGADYTGCQAIFVTTAVEAVHLAWLVEVVKGDPARLWSPQPGAGEVGDCRYQQGVRVEGRRSVCPAAPPLMPSMPAGCLRGGVGGDQCRYDFR